MPKGLGRGIQHRFSMFEALNSIQYQKNFLKLVMPADTSFQSGYFSWPRLWLVKITPLLHSFLLWCRLYFEPTKSSSQSCLEGNLVIDKSSWSSSSVTFFISKLKNPCHSNPLILGKPSSLVTLPCYFPSQGRVKFPSPLILARLSDCLVQAQCCQSEATWPAWLNQKQLFCLYHSWEHLLPRGFCLGYFLSEYRNHAEKSQFYVRKLH